MSLLSLLILAFIQGLAELLPVSSSAHVILAEKLLGLDPSSPEMTFLLVMLHTGTMFAVLVYFWRRWKAVWMTQNHAHLVKQIVLTTLMTAGVGLCLKTGIQKIFFRDRSHFEIEDLFSNFYLMASSLCAAGILILVASRHDLGTSKRNHLETRDSLVVGFVQGLCLPFRGFSRSGATISVSLMRGLSRNFSEDFSFILAVVLTPPVVIRELLRLTHHQSLKNMDSLHVFVPGLLGMIFSFIAGLFALRWLSSWLEKGRWKYFGYYCLFFSGIIFMAAQF